MSGLLRRIKRPGAAEDNRTEANALPEPAHGSAPETAPVRADESPLPAGVSPEDLERRSRVGRRGKARRRVRFLRRARELALRDLGGLVYEASRRDQDGGKLVKEKVAQLGVIDAELRALEAELGTPRGETVLREPGVGGTCPRCRELHASDAHYCSRCGLDLTAVPAEEPVPEQAALAASAPAQTAPEPAPSDAAAEKPSEPAAAAKPSDPAAGEAIPAEPARGRSKRWWRRRSAGNEAPRDESAASDATAADAAPSEATPATSEATPATSEATPATSEATPATPATSEATSATPAASDTAAARQAQPAPTGATATEQPTTDLAPGSPQAGNGRAAKQDAPDRERSA